MKILLIGEYSNIHATLASAWKGLGHEVTLVSNGDGWRNYPRDIDITRRDPSSKVDGIRLVARLLWLLPRLKGYDVVQIINPKFLHLKARFSRWMLRYLKLFNRKVSMGCFGIDSIVMRRQNEGCLAYSDTFCYGKIINHDSWMKHSGSWLAEAEIHTTEYAARTADCLIACLYEYYRNYDFQPFCKKLHYIALPIKIDPEAKARDICFPVKILVGTQPKRIVEKGINQILPLLETIAHRHPDKVAITKVENVPFSQYCQLLAETDVLADQLYSYTPAMNALEAMKRGTVVITGGEEEYYSFIGEPRLRPIINLRPEDNDGNQKKLEAVLLDLSLLRRLSAESIEFVKKHHDSSIIGQQYLDIFGL